MTIKGLSGQSAIEYLMTYGWMLLIVTSAGGGIYSILGDQSIESVSGFDGQNIAVSNFALTTGGDLDFEINNRGSSKIRVKKLYLEDGSSSFSVPQHIQINPG